MPKPIVSNRRSPEAQQAIMELRRSNAAQPHKNKKAYTRHPKHKGNSND